MSSLGDKMETEEAIEKARGFLMKEGGYLSARLVSVKLENGRWIMKFDVGILSPDIVRIEMDESGKLLSFEKIGYP